MQAGHDEALWATVQFRYGRFGSTFTVRRAGQERLLFPKLVIRQRLGKRLLLAISGRSREVLMARVVPSLIAGEVVCADGATHAGPAAHGRPL
jgi:hypothetical protein